MIEKESENILEKAVKAMNDQQVPPGPPQELADSTLAKLTELSGQTKNIPSGRIISLTERIKLPNGFFKAAAAAIVLITAGYAAGRLLSPKPPDIEQLQVVLEPAIRSRLVDEMKQYWQLALVSSYTQLKDDLTQQYRRDLNQVAAYTLAASGTATNRLLEELIESINQAQTQDRQWYVAVLGEIELNRLKDNAQLSDALATFAAQTEENMSRILSYSQPDSLIPDRFLDPNNLN